MGSADFPDKPEARSPWLGPWERRGLALFFVVVVLFGLLVERRSAFLQRRMGDLNVFLRAAWAVRAGEDIYTITDPNDFHYHYPPLFAILLTPLADPPPGADHAWTLPYPVSVGLCYTLNLLCLFVAVHWLAGALEQRSGNPAIRGQAAGTRRWWALRLWPVLACLPPVGHTLMRGQVSLLLLLLLAGAVRSFLRGRRLTAGLWLAGAICLKVIPAFLLIYPLWRRDYRSLVGCALGLFVGLAAVPAAVFGPARTVAYYQEWAQVLVLPGLGKPTDHARDKELIEATATDSQSFQVIFHNALHPDRATRPPNPSDVVRRAHWLAGALLTAVTLLLARRRRPDDAPAEVLLFGSLTLIMLLLSPVCHLHYFALAVPLWTALLAAAWEDRTEPRLGVGLALLAAAYLTANVLPNLPAMERLRDGGSAFYGALLLWLVAGAVLWQRARRAPPQVREQPERVAA